MEVSDQLGPTTLHLPSPESDPVSIVKEAPEPVWAIWKMRNFWPYRDLNSDSPAFQPVASRYTD
jgi:hypothetical protein